jgi:hypothetical protein
VNRNLGVEDVKKNDLILKSDIVMDIMPGSYVKIVLGVNTGITAV